MDFETVAKERYELEKGYQTPKNYTIEHHMDEEMAYHKKWITEHVFDPTATIFTPKTDNPLNNHQGFKMYKTLDNYAIGYIVMINENIMNGRHKVFVYGRTTNVIPDEYSDNEEIVFDVLLEEYDALEIFIGKSPLNKMTEFSGGHGDKWDGNSILLRIGNVNEYKYVFIGNNIFEFVTDEQIIKYISSVGNNCVPYPYAESSIWGFCMCSEQMTPIIDHPNRDNEGTVFDNGNASYSKMNVTKKHKRGTDNIRYPADVAENTRCVRFVNPGELRLVENTCGDTSLPLVNQINEILGETE